MKIITISQEFGSGVRELGKRLVDLLGYDYYDKEIISTIANHQNLNGDYVNLLLDNHGWKNIPLSFRQSFFTSISTMQTNLLLEQKKDIKEGTKLGKDGVIVGRNADVILREYETLNLFVCADMEVTIQRCIAFATEKKSKRKIHKMDRYRAQTREISTKSKWGEREVSHLIVNTTSRTIKELMVAVKQFIDCWFRRRR